MKHQWIQWSIAPMITAILLIPTPAMASHCWWDHYGHEHCDQGQHRGWYKHEDTRQQPLLDWKTKEILKGGVVGAGVGAGAGLLLHKSVGKTALVGALVGSGTQATRYSKILRQHPVGKMAVYGALAGAGASQLTHEGSLGKGALWGAAIGGGLGFLQNSGR